MSAPPGAPDTVKYVVFGFPGAPHTVKYLVFGPGSVKCVVFDPGAPRTLKNTRGFGPPGASDTVKY